MLVLKKMRQMESLLISIKWNQTENSLEKTLMRIHWWIYQNPLSRWECFSRYLYWIKRIIMKLLLGLKEVPVRIMNLTDQEVVEISLVENIQRENLNPIEEAFAYKRLLTEFHLKQDEVAERVSKSRTAVTNSMRLLKLDERVQQMVIDDMITTGHARALLGIEDAEKQFATAQKIFDENLSVRETEKLVKKIQNNKDIPVEKKKVSDPAMEAIYHDLEEKMKSILGTKVAINKKDDQKGKIEIEYYSMDELDRIIDLIRTIA